MPVCERRPAHVCAFAPVSSRVHTHDWGHVCACARVCVHRDAHLCDKCACVHARVRLCVRVPGRSKCVSECACVSVLPTVVTSREGRVRALSPRSCGCGFSCLPPPGCHWPHGASPRFCTAERCLPQQGPWSQGPHPSRPHQSGPRPHPRLPLVAPTSGGLGGGAGGGPSSCHLCCACPRTGPRDPG